MSLLSVFVKYRALIDQLVMRDIKTKYRRSVLGLLWTVLNPLLMMTVLSIVFSYFFSRYGDVENFPVYLKKPKGTTTQADAANPDAQAQQAMAAMEGGEGAPSNSTPT